VIVFKNVNLARNGVAP